MKSLSLTLVSRFFGFRDFVGLFAQRLLKCNFWVYVLWARA
jgi:hypothetical protein